MRSTGKARPDRLALKPYWGKRAVRNFRESDGNVGIIRSPVRAIALPDLANAVAAALDLYAVRRLVGLDIAGPRVAFTSG